MSTKFLLVSSPVSEESAPTSGLAHSKPAPASAASAPAPAPASRKAPVSVPSYLYFGYVTGLVFLGYYLSHVYRDYISTFEYRPRTTLLHAAWIPCTAVTLYAVVIFSLKKLMEHREPVSFPGLKLLMAAHNGLLSAWSFVMLMKIMEQVLHSAVIPSLANTLSTSPAESADKFLEALFCDASKAQAANKALYFWYHVFYISKYYELLDTVFICIKKKPLIFLHYYHHIVTLLLCWVTMDDYIAPQWICVSTNTLVHVFMYYYYMLQTMGHSVWWKRHLTKLQIIQFVADELGNFTFIFYAFVLGATCSGSWWGVIWGVGVISSFLILFLQFYSNTYTNPAARKKPLDDGQQQQSLRAKEE